MFAVDTNVLVHAVDGDSPFHTPCLAMVERLRTHSSAWFVTWSILYEFLRVSTHPRALRAPFTMEQAKAFVDSLLASPGLRVLVETPRHARVLEELLEEVPFARGNLFHDLHTVALMREHGVSRVYTRDLGFHRFPAIEVVDPVASERSG